MKQLVCDFCESVRIGASSGYKEFKNAFHQARQVRIYAEKGNFIKADLTDRPEDKLVNTIREMAQKNYKETKADWGTVDKPYNPVDGIQTAARDIK